MRKLILSLVTLGMLGGVANAQRFNDRDHRRPVPQQRSFAPQRSFNHGAFNRRFDNRTINRFNNRTVNRYNYGYRYNDRYRFARRPIYVQRPIIRHRYFNYYQRPSLLIENYAPMYGYYWVAGTWYWDGVEWIWQPGHYQPDPSYNTYYYEGY